MGDTVAGAVATSAFLAFVALPLSTLLSVAAFLPWRRIYWTTTHATSVLRRHGLALLALLLMLVPENLESLVDPWVTAHLPWRDAPTAFIASYEWGYHAWLQALPGKIVLQPVFSVIYLIGFPYLIIATTMLAIWRDDGRRARQAAASYALCFAFALPTYLFLPVNEVWYFYGAGANTGTVQQLALHYPIVRESLYAFNEVNNCFPSLHTAISVAMALVARGVPRYGKFAAVWAGLIVFSTMYLGIHWATDVVAGIGLAFLVNRIVRRIWPEPTATPEPAAGQPPVGPTVGTQAPATAPQTSGMNAPPAPLEG